MAERPRSAGYIYAVLAFVLLLIVGLLAFTQRQPPPPSVAEFAPQAVDRIEDSPDDQSSSSGRSGGAGEASAPTPTPEPAGTIDVPRARRCVGDPPRQIEDPQSPPCVPYWEGDNGGATSKGVTRDEIRIAQPTSDGGNNVTAQLAQFFNKRFEFYGRKLTVLPDSGYQGSGDPVVQRADAAAQDAQNVFASLYYRTSDGLPYRQELARRKVLSMGIYWPNNHDQLANYRPYMWQYHEETDRTWDAMGRWICRRLAGRDAAHAGQDQAVKPRVFGIILQVPYQEDTSNWDSLEASMQGECGVKPAIKRRNPVAGNTLPVEPVSATNTMVAFKDAGVTSVVCLCNFFAFGALGNSAQSQGYSPEWLTAYSLDVNGNFTLSAAGREQLSHTFGLVSIPRQVSPDREPYWVAVKEVDPTFRHDTGEGPVISRMQEYRNLLLYASGIQMAGPNLTPQTFEAALHRTRFPNPPHPLNAGAVGFPREAHGMTTDYAEYWWSVDDRGPYFGEESGTMCYVQEGRRHTAATLGTDGGDPFFNSPCSTW